MFQKYQSLPKIVEAVQFTEEHKDMIFNDMIGPYCADLEDGMPILKVTTMHGDIAIVRIGDWIVKDRYPGTYYPVKNVIFCSHNIKLNMVLEPCPFCGGEAVIDEFADPLDKVYWVECFNGECTVCPETDNFSTPEQAVLAWNTRCQPIKKDDVG